MTYDALPSFAARSEEGSATLGFSKSEHGACAWSQRSAFPASPAEDAEGVQRDPAARLALAFAEVDQQLVVVGMLEGPSAVGIALGLHDARSPRRPARPARRQHPAGSRARGGCHSATRSGTRTGASRPRLCGVRSPRQSTADGTACARAGTPGRGCGRQRPRHRRPWTRSNSSRPSSTLIVVSNDPRVEPFSCSQFQPPSSICSVK